MNTSPEMNPDWLHKQQLVPRTWKFLRKKLFKSQITICSLQLDSRSKYFSEEIHFFRLKCQNVKRPRQLLFFCKATNGRCFGGFFANGLDPHDEGNAIFSLTGKTVHEYNQSKCNSESTVLQAPSEDSQQKYLQAGKNLILRMGEKDLIIYTNRQGRLLGRSSLGRAFQNSTENEHYLVGRKRFELALLLVFEMDSDVFENG